MIDLLLIREIFTDISTIGRLLLNGKFFCYTLEDKYRGREKKVYGETCIPEGVYKVTLVESPKRGYIVPLLHDVRDFTAIEIHIGNYPKDTLGCILVGLSKGVNQIHSSTAAFRALMAEIGDTKEFSISVICDVGMLPVEGV